jgi:SOS-response transcriptional repressor LexA
MFTVPENEEDSVTYQLTPQQERVWRQMRELQAVNGGKPATQGEISKALGMRSKQGCAVHFAALAKAGCIVCTGRNTWRSWLAVEPDATRPVTEYKAPRKPSAITIYPRSGTPGHEPLAPFVLGGNTISGGPTEADGLTLRQIEVWRVADALQEKSGGNPPAQREVSHALGMTSVQGSRAHYVALERAGFMKHKNRKWVACAPEGRSIQIIEPTPEPSDTNNIPDFTDFTESE